MTRKLGLILAFFAIISAPNYAYSMQEYSPMNDPKSYQEIVFHAKEEATGKTVKYPIIKVQNSDFSLVLADRSTGNYKIEPRKQYYITVSKIGYYTLRDTIQFEDVSDKDILTHTIALKKIVAGEKFELSNIYYEKNSEEISLESIGELEKLVRFMTDNPSIEIEIASHTDASGSETYNRKLSQKRAESVAQYLMDSGIAPERITPKGYGEDQLLNHCKEGVECSEEEHKENRRTEIRIL